MVNFVRFCFFSLFLVFFASAGRLNSAGTIIPTGTGQQDFLKTYKLVMVKSHADYRFTGNNLDSVLFPKWGEFSVYWISSGPDRGSFVLPETVPAEYKSVTGSEYDNYNWKDADHYSVQFKHDTKRIAIFRSNIKVNSSSVSWEALYFKNTFDSYLYDNIHYFINETEIDTAWIYGGTELIIIPAFAANGADNKFYIDSIFAACPNLKTRFNAYLSRGGNIYAEGNAVYFIEKLGFLPEGSVDFTNQIQPDPVSNLINVSFVNNANPVSFTRLATGDTLYAGSIPLVSNSGAEVIAEIPGKTPVVFVLKNSKANNGRIICNTGLPTIGGINSLKNGSRQLQWTLNTIFYAFSRNIDVVRSVWNDLPDTISAGKNAVSYDRQDIFEVRLTLRNLSGKQVDNISIREYIRDYFEFAGMVTSGITNTITGRQLDITGISLPPHSEKVIVYNLRTPKENDPIHENVNKYISWATYIYCSYGVTSYNDDEGRNTFIKYRNYADVMFSAKLAADADLNWKNFLGLYYQPFKLFMIMENKERTPAMETKYIQYIPKDVPFYWTDNSINIPILKTPGGKFVDVLKGSNDDQNPEFDMDSDGHPDAWLDTASIYPKGYKLEETEVYWLNPWEHLRSGDAFYYEDIDHDGQRARDLDGDGVVDVEEPGDKIRVWKVTWDIGKVAGYDYFDPYCYYEIWVDPPDLVPLSAGVGKAHNLSGDVKDMFYPYTQDIANANLSDTTWKHWMERDENGNVIWKQLIFQKLHNYEGFTFIDTLRENYRLLGSDNCVGTVPQPHREFIAVLSLGGEEIDMTKPTPNQSLYSKLEYKTIFNEQRTTPIRSTYTYYAPLPNPLQFEYLSNNYIITDSTGTDTLQFLPEWGKANLSFDIDASTEYTYYWIRNVGHDVDYNDPSEKMEGDEKLGDGVFGYMIYDLPKGMGGYSITLPKKDDGTYDLDKIVQVDGRPFTKWLDNPNTKDSLEIWEDPYQYHIYIPQLLIPPALDDDNHDGIDDWIDDRGDRFCSSTGYLHDMFMLDDGDQWRDYPETPFQDDIYGMVDSGWYHGADMTYGDDFFENLGKTHFKINAIYEGKGREGSIEISKGGWLVVEEIFGGSPWVLFSHTLSGYATGVDLKIDSRPMPSVVKYGIDTTYIKHTIYDANEPHEFDISCDPYHVSYGYGESTVTTYAGGKDPCNLIVPAIDMSTIIDPSGFSQREITLIPDADPNNPELEGFPKIEYGSFLEVKVEVMNGTNDNWLNTKVVPSLGEELGYTELIMSYVAYPRPLVPAKVDPETGKVIQGGDDLGSFRAGWRFNQPEGEVLIKMGSELPLLQPSRRAYFVFLFKIDESLVNGVYDIAFDLDGKRVYYDGTNKGSIDFKVPDCRFSIADRARNGNILQYQKYILGSANIDNIKTNMTSVLTGLEDARWSTEDVNNTNFDDLDNYLPASFDPVTSVETIDMSSIGPFPTLEKPRLYVLEKTQAYSYNASDRMEITTTEDLNFTYDGKTGSSSSTKLTLASYGPKINMFKRIYSINGRNIRERDTIRLDVEGVKDLKTMIVVSNSGNDIDENTQLWIYPGPYFEIVKDSLPEYCTINGNIVEVKLGSFIPGESKQFFVHFKPSDKACMRMFDSSTVIGSMYVTYKGNQGKDVFSYPDYIILDFPVPDFAIEELTSNLNDIHRGSLVNLTAKVKNGVREENKIKAGIYAVINGSDTILVGQEVFENMPASTESAFTTEFLVPDTVNYVSFFAAVDDSNDVCEICENNNVKSLNVNFRGPDWILEVSNYPNPFSYKTDLEYILPKAVSSLSITLYSLEGAEALTLFNCPSGIGRHSVNISIPDMAKGTYVFKVKAFNERGEALEYTGTVVKE